MKQPSNKPIYHSHKKRKSTAASVLFTTLALWLGIGVQAQDSTRYTLSASQVMAIVQQYHPLARKAALQVEKAEAEQTMARGGFDPVWNHNTAQKRFDGTNYYFYNKSHLEIPLWFGVNIVGGIEYLEGSRVSPEETTGRTGFAGLEIPLAQNLLMDKRRAALKKAAIYRDLSETEQRLALNDLLLESLDSYWRWVQAWREWQLVSDVLTVNERRMEFVRRMVQVGEMAAIDSTEARSQLQYYRSQYTKALLNRQKATLELSVYLWRENDQPYLLPDNVVPDNSQPLESIVGNIEIPGLDSLLSQSIANHPALQAYDQKLDILEVEKRLRFQSLLPDVKLKYNQLGRGYEVWNHATGPLLDNNYRYGISVAIPLRLSEGRGGYRKARIEISQTRLERMQKEQELRAKVQQLYAGLLAGREQVIILTDNRQQNERLLQAEEFRLQNGESSLFLVNSRENRALDARLTLLNAQIEMLRTVVALEWAVANLN